MIKRVLDERFDKAKKADYKVILSDNLFGEHTLINEKGKSHQVTLWDFETKTGYINNIDWKTNKLCTTKHILYLFNYILFYIFFFFSIINKYIISSPLS